jgi:hypothetical protein
MNELHECRRRLAPCLAILFCTLAVGCSGSDQILGASSNVAAAPEPPAVTVVTPEDGAISVPLDAAITATLTQPVSPFTGAAAFTLTCPAPCPSAAGTVTLDATNTVATFSPSGNLAPLTLYTATLSGAQSVETSLPMSNPFTWQFITAGSTPDASRPRVTRTEPVTTNPGPTADAPINAAIVAVFSKKMAPATIDALNPDTFTVTCAAPCLSPTGTVSYAIDSRTAIFRPAASLATNTTYTATITTAATDLAGNALAGNQASLPAASNYEWTFTTAAAAAPSGNVTVASTAPPANALNVCPNATVSAAFAVPSGLRLDPATVNAATFTVTGPVATPVNAASIVLDVGTGQIATFTPQTAFTVGDTYTATIIGGANGIHDLAIPANEIANDFSWTFTAGSTTQCPAPAAIPLRTAAPFGTFGGSAGMTNSGIQTVIHGDIGTIATASSSITGFHDTAGDIYTESAGANVGAVNGRIYTCTNSTTGPTSASPNTVSCAVATQARLDAQAAYLELEGMPPGANPGANLASLTLAPGVYTAPAGSFLIEGGDLTLDAQGDANAVWVFQMATTLTVGGPGAAAPQSIILTGGAQAKNVFWQVGSFATINAAGGGTMVGTIISQAGAALSTAGNVNLLTLNGRVLSLGASVTMVNTAVNVPAP